MTPGEANEEQKQRDAQEQLACAQQPAVFSNKFWIAQSADHVRIAFMEVVPPHGTVRAAILLNKTEARSLAITLGLMLSEGIKQ